MKQAKILLGSLALVAVVGTTLAFEAKRSTLKIYRLNEAGTACPLVTSGLFKTTTGTGNAIVDGTFRSDNVTPQPADCTVDFTYTAE